MKLYETPRRRCGTPRERCGTPRKCCETPIEHDERPAHPQYANYWAPLTRKRHTMPHSAQPQHTNYWAPRTWKRHQQEHRPQRPPESSDPTQHAKGRTGDRPGPRKGATTRRNVTQGAGVGVKNLCLEGFERGSGTKGSEVPRHGSRSDRGQRRHCKAPRAGLCPQPPRPPRHTPPATLG